jgi:3-isopropylmalate/(R)-2-methylmalate dehydratase large subunit
MTLAEKILAKASGKEEVKAGEYVTASIDLAVTHDGLTSAYAVLEEAGVTSVWDSNRVVNVLDHYVPSPTVRVASNHKLIRKVLKELGILHAYGGNIGICHQIVPEKGHVVPGELIVGADSHTVTYGAFGAAATGIGVSEMAYVLATGRLWFLVPESIKFEMGGELSPGVMSKDLLLYLAGKFSVDVAQYKAIEYGGSAAGKMSLAGRMTMSNMSVELGAKFGFFEPDGKVEEFLKNRTTKASQPLRADHDAVYERVLQVNASEVEPQVAFPHNIDNVRPISQVGSVRVDQAFLGSCTNGRLEDLKAAAEVLRDRKVCPDVRFLVIPASWEVYRRALEVGILKVLVEAGATVCNPGCGPCFGAHQGLLADGERCISSSNRNFRGRMGSPEAEVYLGSPLTVAASAVEGEIADGRKYLS